MDTTPLGMQFSEFDTDHDGKINAQQAHELLKLLGKNVYQGTVNNVLITLSLGYRYDELRQRRFFPNDL